MSSNHFRIAAWALIGFNLAGTGLTWIAHLWKPGTTPGHAVLQGTEFTGPLLFIAIWVACVLALAGSRRVATIAMWLMTLFAVGFSVGEISELTKSNVGVSTSKWNAILALDVIGLAIALVAVAIGVLTIVRHRRTSTPHQKSALKEAHS